MQAAAIAKARTIPIYTIGAGRDGYVPVPQFDEQGRRVGTARALSDLDEGAYAYLLGMYLGDGCITLYRRWRRGDGSVATV